MSHAIDWKSFAPEQRKETKAAVHTVGQLLQKLPLLLGVTNDEEYNEGKEIYAAILKVLPDEDLEDPTRDELALLWLEDALGRNLSAYANKKWQPAAIKGGTPAAVLGVIMDEHSLTQSDLPEVGSQGVVSEILNGKRELNLRQIRALSQRFNIPQRFFLGE